MPFSLLRHPLYRHSRNRFIRFTFLFLLLLFSIDTISLIRNHQHAHAASSRPPYTTSNPQDANSTLQPPESLKNEKYFIASTHWNNARILRSHWNAAVLDLVQVLGPENVYVSIYESGSWDDTKAALKQLDAKLGELGVQRRIVLDVETHKGVLDTAPSSADDESETPTPGWIRVKDKWELRRIPYLSRLRNLSLEPLLEESSAPHFTKILFLNDVVFTPADILTLLLTNSGTYTAACSLDFSSRGAQAGASTTSSFFGAPYYDTFALRDSDGLPTTSLTFPFFRRGGASREAMMRMRPVPVRSCWNGVVVMDAEAFYPRAPPPDDDSTAANSRARDRDRAGGVGGRGRGGLRFRGVGDELAKMHLEGSECCFIHVDNPLNDKDALHDPGHGSVVNGREDHTGVDAAAGVWLNPHVRVGYSREAYDAVHPVGSDGVAAAWPSGGEVVRGVWKNRVLGGGGKGYSLQRLVRKRAERWRKAKEKERAAAKGTRQEADAEERGLMCLIDEMHVLRENGWAHI